MKLIDTSAWIHGLRPDGNPKIKERVRALLDSGEAAWCAMVRLELWNGARGEHERRVLKDIDAFINDLEISSDVWRKAGDLAQKARAHGKIIPSTDLLIAACARHHGVEIEHADAHFDTIAGF